MIGFASCSLFISRGRVSPRQATYFLLLRQKKVSKEKATLLSATLRFAAGNQRCSRLAGSRRTRFAQTAASPDPRTAALLGAARRAWTPDAPSLRSACSRAFASLGRGAPAPAFPREGKEQCIRPGVACLVFLPPLPGEGRGGGTTAERSKARLQAEQSDGSFGAQALLAAPRSAAVRGSGLAAV